MSIKFKQLQGLIFDAISSAAETVPQLSGWAFCASRRELYIEYRGENGLPLSLMWPMNTSMG